MIERLEFPGVFSICVSAFGHLVPALTYRRKKGIAPEVPELLPFTAIWTYAPPLFEHSVLESLLTFVNSSRVLA
ncbi:MAG: hypothetical protein ACOY3P_21745, partial [Planctomycetota bacterium]